MSLSDYMKVLQSADALIMNCVRPQGFGNTFMMMLQGKPVFINKRNYSLPDLDGYEIKYFRLEDLPVWFNDRTMKSHSRKPLLNLLSQEKADNTYKSFFS